MLGPHPLVQAPGEQLILGRVADEAGIELDRLHRAEEGRQILDQGIRDTTATEERLGDLAFGAVDGVDADRGWAAVIDCGKTDGTAEVTIRNAGLTNYRTLEICPAKLRPPEIRSAKICILEICPVKFRPPEV